MLSRRQLPQLQTLLRQLRAFSSNSSPTTSQATGAQWVSVGNPEAPTDFDTTDLDLFAARLRQDDPSTPVGVEDDLVHGIVSDTEGQDVVRVAGLTGAKINSLVQFESGERGFVYALGKNTTQVALIDKPTQRLKRGTHAVDLRAKVSVACGSHLIGRVVNCVGEVVDGLDFQPASDRDDLDLPFSVQPVLGVKPIPTTHHGPITHSLRTGLTAIDALSPIGMGSRVAIAGPKTSNQQCDKTALWLDIVLAQQDNPKKFHDGVSPVGLTAVVALIGKSQAHNEQIIAQLRSSGALDSYCVVVQSSSDEPVGARFLAAQTAAAIAQSFMHRPKIPMLQGNGGNALLVVDGMSELSFAQAQLSRLASGPGQKFGNLHAKLMERCYSRNWHQDGGSLTGVFVVDSDLEEYTEFAFSPEEMVSSAADQTLRIDPGGVEDQRRPALPLDGLTFSQPKWQPRAVGEMSSKVKDFLLSTQTLASNVLEARQFGFEPEDDVQQQLEHRQKCLKLFSQDFSLSQPDQILILHAAQHPQLAKIPLSMLHDFHERYLTFIHIDQSASQMSFQRLQLLEDHESMPSDLVTELDGHFEEFVALMDAERQAIVHEKQTRLRES